MANDTNISYARHYRPSTLEGYIGNQKIKETVRNLFSSGNFPQSILLMGNTGCGKTTLSRIITSWYMCTEPNEDGSPCGCCDMCTYMQEYIRTGNDELLPDIQEIDTTDKSGKSDMNSLLEDIEYPAFGGGWKVYILDECHAMSPGAATRLLKVLEEPPEKVLLIFCTTDPQRMLETLKNRCQLKFKVVKPTMKDLTKLLADVCVSEGKEYDMQGLRMLAARADFVIRDSLNYLEIVIGSRGCATGESVSEEFLEISDNLVFEFYQAYIDKNHFEYINIMYRIKTTYDFPMFLQSLVNFTIRGIYILNNITVEGLSELEMQSYMKVFSSFTIEEISYILSSLQQMSFKGDVEANLIAFIYTSGSMKSDSMVNITDVHYESTRDFSKSAPRSVESGNVHKPEGSLNSSSDERRLRDRNIQNLEKGKVEKGLNSLKGISQEKPFGDMMSLFNIEKVDK